MAELGKWTTEHSTNGIWTFYELDNNVFEYVMPVQTVSVEITEPSDVSSVNTATESDDNQPIGIASTKCFKVIDAGVGS